VLFPDVLSLTADLSACLTQYVVDLQAIVGEYQYCVRHLGGALPPGECVQLAQEALRNAAITAISCLVA
jgi:hypothetical protein